MDEFGRHGKVGVAALRSGMHRDTAAKYLRERKLPTLLRVAVLVRVPLAATDHLQAGRVDDQMEGAVALPDSARRWSDLAGTASCGRARAARGPSSGPGSPRSPRSAGAPGGTATGASGRSQSRRRSTPSAPTDAPKGGVPGVDGVGVEPDRDVSPSAQRLLVRRPVPHSVLRLVLRRHLALCACGHLRRLRRLILEEHRGPSRSRRRAMHQRGDAVQQQRVSGGPHGPLIEGGRLRRLGDEISRPVIVLRSSSGPEEVRGDRSEICGRRP
jgi:hypothetical protein